MRHILPLFVVLFASCAVAQDVTLPKPETDKGLGIMQTFAERRSTREFSSRELAAQDLSNLLWAALGVNRADGKLTAPSCRNFQEIHLYVFTAKGVYEYMNKSNSLRHIADGDHRGLIAGAQDFVLEAPVSLVMVADMENFGKIDEKALMMASVDAGIVSENICIAAAGLGLATVPRATMDSDAIRKLLALPDTYIPIMNNPVGYFKK